MRKQFAVLVMGCLTLEFMATLASAQADKRRGRVRRRGNLRAGGWQDDYGGLFESEGEGPEDLRRIGAVRRVWRTGANEATTFVTTADVMVGGTHVPAGSYTIFTISQQGQVDAGHQQEKPVNGARTTPAPRTIFGAHLR